jgi:uncharacterized protein YbjQ (UPF0145 family)
MNGTARLLLEAAQLWVPLGLVLLGYGVGRVIERRHYASLRRRERDLQGVVAISTRFPPAGVAAGPCVLVSGSVVVSSDYFKTFVAGFRNLFGGRFRGYETLLERARREALLRLKAQARERGAALVIGVRFHGTRVSAQTGVPSVEMMAYGTALLPPGAPER